MYIVERQCKRAWIALAVTGLLAACASKRAVPVNCERHLSPINVPAVIADPATDELQVPEASGS